jgi:hypothetical protein
MRTKEECLSEEIPANCRWEDKLVNTPINYVEKAMQNYAEDMAIDYAHWLLERIFSRIMERPDREGRKLFSVYQQEKSSLK